MLPSLTRLLPVRPQRAAPPTLQGASLWPRASLKLLSFNIQAGMGIHAPHHYFTRGHRHILPHARRHEHLERIARLLSGYDVVALQEVDCGSLRSGYLHQLSHLAEHAGFGWWFQQLNRDLGHFGQYSNGLLSQQPPFEVEAHALPGLRGRGAIVSKYGTPANPLLLLNVHLALSTRARLNQFGFLNELIDGARHVVIMGDLNCSHEEWMRSPLGRRSWVWVDEEMPTYPSWKPARQIDHILVSEGLTVRRAAVVDALLSDHRPLEVELELPAGLYDDGNPLLKRAST